MTRQTARRDLKELAAHGLLNPIVAGNGFLYLVSVDLGDRPRRFGKGNGRRRPVRG